jgi:hypothetical protein
VHGGVAVLLTNRGVRAELQQRLHSGGDEPDDRNPVRPYSELATRGGGGGGTRAAAGRQQGCSEQRRAARPRRALTALSLPPRTADISGVCPPSPAVLAEHAHACPAAPTGRICMQDSSHLPARPDRVEVVAGQAHVAALGRGVGVMSSGETRIGWCGRDSVARREGRKTDERHAKGAMKGR